MTQNLIRCRIRDFDPKWSEDTGAGKTGARGGVGNRGNEEYQDKVYSYAILPLYTIDQSI